MPDPFDPRVGGILSADIAVPQHERVVRFYARILSTGNSPLWREDLMNNLGIPVIGVGPQSAEYADLPTIWMPHIQVDDVAGSVKRALDLGGREFAHAKGDDGTSQWAVLFDPDGAAFGLIPVVSRDDVPLTEDSLSHDGAASIGCISWVDLTVADASTSRDFYQQVVGWSVKHVEMEDAGERYADYNMIGGDGNPAAGVCHARGANAGLPPVWMLYLSVGDIAESVRRVQEEGGKIIKQTTGTDGKFTYAVIQDPVGAYLALVPG